MSFDFENLKNNLVYSNHFCVSKFAVFLHSVRREEAPGAGLSGGAALL